MKCNKKDNISTSSTILAKLKQKIMKLAICERNKIENKTATERPKQYSNRPFGKNRRNATRECKQITQMTVNMYIALLVRFFFRSKRNHNNFIVSGVQIVENSTENLFTPTLRWTAFSCRISGQT